MELSEIIKYLTDHLRIEIETSFDGYSTSNNQEVKVALKIGDVVITESSGTIFIDT